MQQHKFDVIGNSLSFRQISVVPLPRLESNKNMREIIQRHLFPNAKSTIQNWNVMLIDEVKTSQSNVFLSTMMKRNCLFISFYTPKKCMEEHYEHTLVLKIKLWYLENEMITEQGYISSKDIRRAPGEVWKVAFPKVKINIREQTSTHASFPQKVKVQSYICFLQLINIEIS